jgi:hypothetical protein
MRRLLIAAALALAAVLILGHALDVSPKRGVVFPPVRSRVFSGLR